MRDLNQSNVDFFLLFIEVNFELIKDFIFVVFNNFIAWFISFVIKESSSFITLIYWFNKLLGQVSNEILVFLGLWFNLFWVSELLLLCGFTSIGSWLYIYLSAFFSPYSLSFHLFYRVFIVFLTLHHLLESFTSTQI